MEAGEEPRATLVRDRPPAWPVRLLLGRDDLLVPFLRIGSEVFARLSDGGLLLGAVMTRGGVRGHQQRAHLLDVLDLHGLLKPGEQVPADHSLLLQPDVGADDGSTGLLVRVGATGRPDTGRVLWFRTIRSTAGVDNPRSVISALVEFEPFGGPGESLRPVPLLPCRTHAARVRPPGTGDGRVRPSRTTRTRPAPILNLGWLAIGGPGRCVVPMGTTAQLRRPHDPFLDAGGGECRRRSHTFLGRETHPL